MNADIINLNKIFTGNFPLILASASPRRRALLQQLGLQFKIIPSYIEEKDIPGTPEEKARVWALLKSEAVARKHSGVIIGADTIVVLKNTILGKPSNPQEAKNMLYQLSGNTHQVITGLALINTQKGRHIITSVKSEVTFRILSNEEIDCYIVTNEPMDKAGSYGIQGKAAQFVTQLKGCYTNVIGLPVSTCLKFLKDITEPCLTYQNNRV